MKVCLLTVPAPKICENSAFHCFFLFVRCSWTECTSTTCTSVRLIHLSHLSIVINANELCMKLNYLVIYLYVKGHEIA